MSSSTSNHTHVIRIKAVDGLLFLTYDVTATTKTNESFLSSNGVTHILSIVNSNKGDKSQKLIDSFTENVEVKRLSISNNPNPDVLSSLNDACKWIENALSSSKRQNTNQVLMRAEGDHESIAANAILIGFIMRYLRTAFSTSLSLAQESVPSIHVDENMERQLRIWEFCRYNIYQVDPRSAVAYPKSPVADTSMSMPGTWPLSRVNTGTTTLTAMNEDTREHGSGLHKPAYLAWQRECETLMAAERSRALSKMVALVAKKRAIDDETGTNDSSPSGCLKDFQSRASKESQWARVDEMEKSWNEKLMKGAIMA